MKKITLLFASLLCVAYIAVAQLKLYVYQNDGTRTEFVASTVDSIAFSTITDDPDQPDDPIKPVDPTNGYEYVDLGLPSGTKWATTNVGATTPEGYGNYYAWGETTTKSTYTSSNYNYSSNPTTLPLDRDAAYTSWGSSWRMPTKVEQDELRNTSYTTWTWTTQNGVKGYKVTSKINGNSIFLPAAGYRYYSDLRNAGSDGYYWGSSLGTNDSYYACYLGFNSDDVGSYGHDRCYGRSVRPVLRDVELTFTIMFDGNGGEGTMPAIDGENGDKVTIPASTFTRDGYDFVCWNTKSNGTGTAYNSGQSITLTTNLTLYAQWEEVSSIDKKLYFVNKDGWTDVKAYIWSAEDGKYNITWPGESAYKENYRINGYEVYSYDMSDKQLYDMIIFNGLATSTSTVLSQTSDLEIDYSKPYYYNEDWYASTDEIPTMTYGYEYVDLGLPSGTKWATTNVGATTPEGYGNYYAWGETTTKSTYRSSNYNYSSNPITLPLDRDAAYTNWGSSWRMPTKAEQDELSNTNYTTWTWTTQNGVKGYKVTSKTNGNSIFLPAAGYRYGSDLNYAGSRGDYWSSSLDTGRLSYAYYLYFDSGDVDGSYGSRYYGRSVRPVLAE